MSSTSHPSKRKRVALPLAAKIEVAKKRRSGHSLEDLSKQYGVGLSTISEWASKLEELKSKANNGFGERKRAQGLPLGCSCSFADRWNVSNAGKISS